jgi:hypothetical protein
MLRDRRHAAVMLCQNLLGQCNVLLLSLHEFESLITSPCSLATRTSTHCKLMPAVFVQLSACNTAAIAQSYWPQALQP